MRRPKISNNTSQTNFEPSTKQRRQSLRGSVASLKRPFQTVFADPLGRLGQTTRMKNIGVGSFYKPDNFLILHVAQGC